MSEPLTPELVAYIKRENGHLFGDLDQEHALECAVSTIELLARELGASQYVLKRMGCRIGVTKPILQQWIDWGKAQQNI